MEPDEEQSDFDMKQSRLENPSGWIKLTRYETVRLLIDALLEAPPEYQFNKSELERRTGLSREAIRERLPTLVELGIVEEIEDGEWPEYQLNDDGKVTRELFELNSAVNSVLGGGPKNVQEDTTPSPTPEDMTREVQTTDWMTDGPPQLEGIGNTDRADDDDLFDQPPSLGAGINAD